MNSVDPSRASPDFPEFLHKFKASMQNVFHERDDINRLSRDRGLPPYVLREIMASNPFSVFIQSEYNGRGGDPREGIALVEAAAYESLALGLIFGINWALFIQPVTKFGHEKAKQSVFRDVLTSRKMGGLMITEPDYGSDALHMQTSWHEAGDRCRLRGTKHWAGLTGWADYWILTARKSVGERGLARDIDFFICDVNKTGQRIVVEERYHNLGLYMIPYGRNHIDVSIPMTYRLIPQSTGINMMLDLLHRSRMQFPAMAMGFLGRLLDEAKAHCRHRHVGGKPLNSYDQVQKRLSHIQAAYTICSAMCVNTAAKAGIENDLASHGLEANAIKTFITDLMQDTAQSYLQLAGAKGYRLDDFAGRAVVDSRPFQIFEGSNDILYAQIGESLVKMMKAAKDHNLYRFLKNFDLTQRASEELKPLLGLSIDTTMSQRKFVELGLLLSRIIAMDMVLQLSERGFDRQLIDSALVWVNQEISRQLTCYTCGHQTTLIDYDRLLPSWWNYC